LSNGLPKLKSSPMAAPTRRIVTLVSIVAEGWGRKPDLAHPNEACTLRATLSDGRVIERDALMTYAPNERERVMEAVLKGTGTAADVRAARGILNRRIMAVERVRGDLQREFGNGVPAQ
jgi:hypothetical protein